MRPPIRKTRVLGACPLALLLSFTASGQWQNIGRFDTWTTKDFQRKHESEELCYIRVVRAAKQNGFDRVVFEFEGPVPNYSIGYLPSRMHSYGDSDQQHRIKIAGDAFFDVILYAIPADEKQLAFSRAKEFLPKGQLRMPALLEMEDAGLFEGVYDFLLGLKSRTPFRVTEISKPPRLVIDLKHWPLKTPDKNKR